MDFWKKSSSDTGNSGREKLLPSWAIGAGIGVLFLVLGASNDQFADIYRKAVMICLECIGIG